MKQNPLMYTIIGDIIGSRYERVYFKTRKEQVSFQGHRINLL